MKTRKLLTAVIAILAIAVTNINAQTLPSYVPSNGLVGYWGFNGNANDQSGNGNNGIVNGATLTTDRNGNANSAYSFDGISNYISTADIDLQNTATISIWVYPIGTIGALVDKDMDANSNSGYVFLYNNSNPYGLYAHVGWSGNANNNIFPSNNNLLLNQWYHCVLTLNNGTAKIYVDGLLVYTQTSVNPTTQNNDLLLFGKSVWGGNLFSGKLDDIAIYNRALTQSEITQLYSSSASTQNLCTKTIQPYNVNVGDATHEGSTYAWSISPAAPNAVISGNGNNIITIDWTNVPDGSYTLQAIETSITGCVSTAVTATINLAATPPPIEQPQTFCTSATVANLTAEGTDVKWYASANEVAALPTTTALTTGTYYVSQTIGTCESIRTVVEVTILPQVTPTFTQIASTCSGSTLTALPTISNNGITGTWSPALNNNQTTTYTFTPDVGQCATTTTQTITITAPKVTSPISFVAPPITVAALPNVTIGTQVWTNKNLDISTYRDGTPIPQVTDPSQWENLTTGAWCYYNNDEANGAIYGKLYNWYAVAGIYDVSSLNDTTLRKQFAPVGWHVPSDLEWTTLTTFLGGESVAGGKMKETGTTHWISPNTDATNTSGFTGLPGNNREFNGSFLPIGNYGFWWSSSVDDTTNAWNYILNYYIGNVIRDYYYKTYGLSVRLIKD
jgi:uncharacterized protein (TIGR02145 family)